MNRSTISGIAAYRSALTLDWLAAEDSRQREMVSAFETEPSPPARILTSECISYPRPSTGKVSRLMLELLKNLEGDDGSLVLNLIQTLVRTKLLVETSLLDSEPDLESLVKTPGVMMGEPHITFPRIVAMMWMTVTDPAATKKHGWCTITKVNKYLSVTNPINIAKHMRSLEPVIARARYIMEEFIQNVTPLNMYQKKSTTKKKTENEAKNDEYKAGRRPIRTYPKDGVQNKVEMDKMSTSDDVEAEKMTNVLSRDDTIYINGSSLVKISKCLFIVVLYFVY